MGKVAKSSEGSGKHGRDLFVESALFVGRFAKRKPLIFEQFPHSSQTGPF